MIIINKNLVPKGYVGITIYPFIIARDEATANRAEFINHEQIHLKQQEELFVLLFFLWYGIEFILRYFQYGTWDKAYKNISFEREAYANEHNMKYLNNRKRHAFKNYL